MATAMVMATGEEATTHLSFCCHCCFCCHQWLAAKHSLFCSWQMSLSMLPPVRISLPATWFHFFVQPPSLSLCCCCCLLACLLHLEAQFVPLQVNLLSGLMLKHQRRQHKKTSPNWLTKIAEQFACVAQKSVFVAITAKVCANEGLC